MKFLKRQSCVAVNGDYRKLSDFPKNILICVPKTIESLTGLEWHEGEQLMTEFLFLGDLSIWSTLVVKENIKLFTLPQVIPNLRLRLLSSVEDKRDILKSVYFFFFFFYLF